MKILERVERKISKAGKKSVVTFNLGELFCGPGGLGIGAFSSRVELGETVYEVRHTWSNDYDLDTCRTYLRNICPDNPSSVICCDVRELNIEKLSPIDAFAYGFPCNDFSIVGEQKGFKGKFGPLYTYGVNVLDYFKPKFFVAENVGGITTANEGKAFKKILFDLENAGDGYNLTANLYKSEEYGIPQMRHRVIIVGIERSFNLKFRVPAPTTLSKYKTVKEALENPPIPKNAFNNEKTVQSQTVVKRLQHILPGQNVWTADIPDELKLNVRGAKLSQIYRRLHPDRPSYTLTGSGGGGTHGYHWDEPRALTNRERARIQTFPDSFIFEGSKESVRKQIGMAVPPKLSEAIFTAILKTFAGIEYDYTSPNIGEDYSLFDRMK
ncbi:MAG: DNA (cytosine-5-)-methyltransferase [Candidatus Omnitrophota bacterium]